VWLGQETCVALGKVIEGTRFKAPTSYWFCKTFYIGGANLWLEILILKAEDIFLNFVHIM
jgi:hypothetical protein